MLRINSQNLTLATDQKRLDTAIHEVGASNCDDEFGMGSREEYLLPAASWIRRDGP